MIQQLCEVETLNRQSLSCHVSSCLSSPFFSVHHTEARLSWCVPVQKALTIPHRARGQLVVSGRIERGRKSRRGQICDDNWEGSLSLSQPFATSSPNKNKINRKKKGKKKQSWKNQVDSKSAVRTHGCLLHGSWHLQSACARRSLSYFFCFLKRVQTKERTKWAF